MKCVERPEAAVKSKARMWKWPISKVFVPKPWDSDALIESAEWRGMTRFAVQAEIAFPQKSGRHDSVVFHRAYHWVPTVDFPDTFYGFDVVPWSNLYESETTSDGHVRMEFMDADVAGFAFIDRRGSTVDGERIVSVWREKTAEIQNIAISRHRLFRLDKESVHLFCFNKLANIHYRRGGKGWSAWFNFGNDRVLIEEGKWCAK